MLDWLYEALGTMLYWFSSLFGGKYIFGLLLYALLFKLLFLPFGIMQQKNQIKMAKLTPKIELIKAKYRGRTDKVTMQKQQEEIMELQQKEGYNPLSGCLPLLLQMPIIIFLYKIIRGPLSYICGLDSDAINSIITTVGYDSGKGIDEIQLVGKINEYIGANGGFADLAEYAGKLDRLPDFTLFGMDLSSKPWDSLINLPNSFSLLFLVPVIAAVLTWLSMWLTRKWNPSANMQNQDAQANMSMKIMDLMMPAMTLIFAFQFSGMLGLYWIYQSILGMLQSFILAKTMPLPTFTEEELREMEKAERARAKQQREAIKTQPKVKSLHYIDDEDYDELPEIEGATPTTDDKKKRPGGIEGGSLKK